MKNLEEDMKRAVEEHKKSLIKDASTFFKTIDGKLTCDWKGWDNQTRGARSQTYNEKLRDTFLDIAKEKGILTYPKKDSLFPFDPLYCSDDSPLRDSQNLHFSEEKELKKYMEQLHPSKTYFIAKIGKLIKKK